VIQSFGGDEYCNIPSPSDHYQYADSSLVFLLLSFIGIHFVFIWLSTFRFVEIIWFSLQRRRLKGSLSLSRRRRLHPEHSSKYSHQSIYESVVNVDEISKCIDVDDHGNVMDVVLPQASEEPHDPHHLEDIPEHEIHEIADDLHGDHGNDEEVNDAQNLVQSPISARSGRSHRAGFESFDINQWIAGLYVYGDDQRRNHNASESGVVQIGNEEEVAALSVASADENGIGNGEKLKIPEMPRRGTSLSEFWKATTGIVTQGFILKLSAEDFCCVCWEEFEIGNEIAKLECSHVIHKQCAIDWFSESATCPTCRVPLKKVADSSL